ncbi:MAG TPA: beta-propeller fold lactonase family protein [Caulobacteraceae bacterium]|nr:beta-propeller fold lactonase family protein [Caulobacteraceae bacterium]
MTRPLTASDRPVSAYVAIGPTLINFTVGVAAGQVTRGGAIVMPARVQYVWPHASLPILYVACADRSEDAVGRPFYVCAVRRDAAGDLTAMGEPVALPARPIHVTTDSACRYVLNAYGGAPGLTAHRLDADGAIGPEIPRAEGFDFGASPHQIRVTPSNERAILVARGKKGYGKPGYIEGALKVLRFDGGRLENLYTIVPPSEDGFNPRHLDFHPTRPWVFVSLEEQNRLCVFKLDGAELDPALLYSTTTLAHPDDVRPRQDGGTVHVHPNGKTVYVANRNDGYVGGMKGPTWLTPDPLPVFPGGENSIAVFKIDQDTGEPTLIQVADSHGLHPRTFALDASGKVLVAGNLAPTVLKDGTEVPANLALFGVEDDGKLKFLHRYDLDVAPEMLWWMGVVG